MDEFPKPAEKQEPNVENQVPSPLTNRGSGIALYCPLRV
jgi:hypothetical protein